MAKTQTSSTAVKEAAAQPTNEGALSQAAETTQRTNPMSLEDAIASLDPADDTHWTSDGLARMEVLESLTGGNLTREEVNKAAPDFTRAKAAAAREPAPEPEPAAGEGTGASGLEPEPVAKMPEGVAAEDAGEYMTRLAKQFGWPSLEDLRANGQ